MRLSIEECEAEVELSVRTCEGEDVRLNVDDGEASTFG